ncbi:neuroblast differentiation-associated protein AHNAK-like isoform X2 [Dicentrarchus labrax]|uniref:neuroblast differentiation-associated protein AHNAK-like isoform X2 n=1 Tax=Dicentrarchus labrax TaxID=13489 RepID=UPI0021F5BA4D|nr:neuroblast differentiation-associated protein AHNAK-like isoform X2 [Dicentrarchus labrax]
MCDCFHLAFPNWHAASSGTGAGRRLRAPEPGTEDDSVCDEPSQFTEGERPRPQGSSPVEEYPETEKYTDSDKECEAEHDPHHKSGSGKRTKKSGLGSMFEKRSTPKMSKLKEVPSPESGVIVKTAKDGCAEGLIYGGGGKEGIFIKEVVPESPASKSLKLKEGDQVLSATVYFDNVSYEDAIQILEHAQAYKVKLCLKRKPDITETESAIESDVIPEEDIYAPEMREQGKTKRRGDARISWPKFPSFGKGRKSRFTRSHSSSEADEQRKLELSPTTSDTESPIKSQDAQKGKKRHKIKLSLLTKRGRISSSEDQDTDTPTTGQIIQTHDASDMLSPECLESPSGETPEIYVTGDRKVVEDLRLGQNDQKLTEPQTVQHKVELITIDSTLKTEDLTVALADKDSSSGIKSPDGKKKKKERSELKIKILGKDKGHKKDAKAKSSPKRLKTLGASIEIPDQPEKSAAIPSSESHTKLQDQLAPDDNTRIISSESSRVISAKSVTTQMEMSVPKVELDIPDVSFIRKSPQKGEQKMKDIKQETKTGPTFKLPRIGLGDLATEETIQKMNVNVEECTTKMKQLTTEGTEVKEDPYERLSKSSFSRIELPKREEIEIPGMEDMSRRTTARGIKEPKAGFTGHYEEIQAEAVQMSIDVDSVKEAVSKLPGFKLPKVDTSGVPIPEEIIVIDANAQRISVKTPTKVVDTKTKYETHFITFDTTASPEISKTTVKLPKIPPALTSEELLIETQVDLKKPEKKSKTNAKQSDKEIKTEVYKREDIIIPGKESAPEVAIIQAQDTEGIKSDYDTAATLSPKESEKKSKKAKITASFGIAKPDIKIPDIGIDLPKQNIYERKVDGVKGEKTEARKGKGQTGGVISDVKIPEIDGIEYIDSVGGSPNKKDGGSWIAGFGFSLDATKPNANISFPDVRDELEDVSVNVPDVDKDIHIDGAEIQTLEREGKVSKFKMPNLGISIPKVKGPKMDLSLSKKDVDVTLPETKAEVRLPEVPEVDVTLGNVTITEQKMEVEKPEFEIKPMMREGELDGQGGKFKMPKLGIKMPKMKGPEFDLSISKKDIDVKQTDAKAEGKIPKAPEIDVTFGSVDASIPQQKMKVKTPELENKPLQTDGELDGQGSRFKMPKLGIAMPKVKGPEMDFSLSKKDVDVTLPEAKAEVKLPDVELKEHTAKVEIKAPEFKGAEKDVEGSPSKFKMPSFKLPKFGVGTPHVSVKVPDMDKDVKIDGADINIPEEQSAVNIASPEVDIEGSSIDMKTIGTEQDGKGGKFKMPHLGFSMPKVKGPKIDLSLPKKDLDVTLPEAKADVKLPEAPKIAVEMKSPECEAEMDGHDGKIKIPKFEVKMPKVKGPEFDLRSSKKDVDVKLPETKADVKLPEVDLGKVDVSIPKAKMEVQSPELEMQSLQTDGELDGQGERFKMPKFGIKMPKVKGPEFDLSLSKKDMDVTLPQTKAEVKLPDAPKIDVSLGKAEVLTLDAKAEVEKPELKMKSLRTEVEGQGSKFKMPKFGMAMPKVKGPEFHLGFSKKDVDVTLPEAKVDVNLPDVELKEPSAKVEIKAPDIAKVEVKKPEVEIKPLQTDVELEGQGGKFKMPKFGITMPKVKGPEIDLSLSKKDVDVTLPEAKAEVKLPEAPKIAMEMKPPECEAEIDGQGSKFKMPKFGITMPKVKGPEIDLSFSKKDVDVTLPEAKAEVKLPDAELKEPSAKVEIKLPETEAQLGHVEGSASKFKLPTFKFPKFGAATPNVSAEVSDMDIKVEGAGMNIDGATVAAQNIDIEAPSLDVKMTGTEGKGKESKFKVPKFGISLPKVQGPEIDVNFSKKDVKLPEAKAEVKLPETPEIDINLGKVDVSIPEAKLEVKKPELEMKPLQSEGELGGEGSKFKMPKFGMSMPKVKGPEIDVSLSKKDVEITLPEAKADVNLPDVELKEPSAKVEMKASEIEAQLHSVKGSPSKFKMPTFKFPKFGVAAPTVSTEVPDIDKEIKIDGADMHISVPQTDVDVQEIKTEISLPEAEVKEPSGGVVIDQPGVEVDAKLKKRRFSLPRFSFSKSSVKSPEVDVSLPDVNAAIPEGKVEVKGGDVDTKLPECEAELDGQGSKFKMPKFGITMPKVTGPEIDISFTKKDVDVTLPEAKAEVKLPDTELKEPSAEVEIKAPEFKVVTKDTEASPSKFKMPTFKLPKFGVGMPSADIEVPDTNKDVTIDGADIKIPEEVHTVEIVAPSIDTEGPSIDMKTKGTEHEGKGTKFKMPKFGITMPKVTGPEFDLSLSKKDVDVSIPEAEAEVKVPDAELKQPSAAVEIKAPEFKVVTKDTGGSPSKFKMPTFKLPKFGSPSATVEMPDADKDIKIDGADIKIPEEVLTVEIAAPSIDTEGPSIDMKTTGTEHEGKGSKFKMPSLGFSVHKVKQPDTDLSLSKKDVDVTLPEAKADVKLPDVELKESSAKVEMKAPEIDVQAGYVEGSPSKFKMPTFKLPKFGAATSQVSVEVPDSDKDITVTVDGADLKLPQTKAEVKLPDVEVKEPVGSILLSPVTEGDAKLKKPRFSLPKFSFSKQSTKETGVDVSLPGVDVSLPEVNVEVKQPEVELKPPEGDVELDGQGSKFKMPKFGISMPKVKGPEIDLSLSKKDVDVTLPEAKAEMKPPDVEIKQPSAKVEIKAPEIEAQTGYVEGSPSKLKMPTFTLPKFGTATPKVSVEVPDVDKDIKIDGEKMEVTKEGATVVVTAPSIDTEGLSVDVKATGGEIEGAGSKFKMPKFGISIPKVKGPEIDLSLTKKDADATLPEVKAEVKLPDVQIKEPEVAISVPDAPAVEAEAKMKRPNWTFPKFSFSRTGGKAPQVDVELEKPKVDVTSPEAKAEVCLPDVEVQGPLGSISMEAPPAAELDANLKKTKFSLPKFSFSKSGVKEPDVSTELPNVDVSLPEVNVEVKKTDVELKPPEGDVELHLQESKFKMPKFGISIPKVKGPEIDLSLSKKGVDVTLPEAEVEVQHTDVKIKQPSAKGEIKAPEIEAQAGIVEGSPSKLKMPTFTLPKFGAATPKVSVEVPNMDKDIKIDGATLAVAKEGAKVDVAAPSIDTEGLSVDVKAKGGELEGAGSKFKMPSFGISMPKVKGPEIDLSLSKRDTDIKLPKAKTEVKLPDVELKEPSAEVEIKAPEFKVVTKDTGGSPSKFKMPTFKLPKFGSPSATVEMPDADKGIKIDGADIKIPEEVLTVEIAAPSIDTEGPSIDMKTTGTEHEGKGSKFKMPSLGFSVHKVKQPDTDLSLSKKDVDVTLPEAKADVKLPDVELKESSAKVEMKAPEIDVQAGHVEGSPSKFKMPTFKLPKFGAATSQVSVEVPDSDKDITVTVDGADLKLPQTKAEVKLPDVEVKEPVGSILLSPVTEGDAKLKKPRFSLPKFSFSKQSTKETGVDVSLPGVDVSLPEVNVEVKQPEVELKPPEGDVELDGQGSKFKMPKFGISIPKVKGPEIDLSLSKKDVDVTLPEVKAEIKPLDVKIKQPSAKVEIKAPEIEAPKGNVEGSPSKLKMPTFTLPKFGAATPKVSVEVPDVDKDIKIDGTKPEAPTVGAKVDVTVPSIDTEGMSVDVKAKGSEIEGSGSKFKMPKFGISMPKVKGPEIDLSMSKKDVDVTLPEAKAEIKAPEIEAQTGYVEGSPSKLKMPTFTLPKFGTATPKVSVEVPDVDKDIKIDGEKMEVTKAGATVVVTAPSIDTEGLSVDVKAKGGELEGAGSKFKMPSFGISMPKVKGPEIDLSLTKKDVDITLPEVKAEVKLPDVEVKEPEVAISVPDAPAVEAEAKMKRPNWTFPKFSFSRTGGKSPDVDVNLETPKVDVTSPEVKAEVCLPDIEVQGPSGSMEEPPAAELDANLKKTKFSLPKFSFSKSGVKEPEFSTELPHVDVSLPEGEVKVKQPEMEIKAPELDAEHDGQGSKFKLPKFGITLPKAKGPEGDLSQKDVDITLPEIKAEVKVPEAGVKSSASVEIKAGETETKSKDVGGSPSKFKKPTIKMPKIGGATHDVTVEAPELKEDVSVNIKGLTVDIKTDVSKAATTDTETPKTETDTASLGSPSKFKLPSFKMPKLSFSRSKPEDGYSPVETEYKDDKLEMEVEPKGEIKSPKMSLTSFGEILKNIDVEFDVSKNLETSKEVHERDEPSEKQLEAKEKETNTKQDTTKSPEKTGWFKFPKFGLSSPTEPAKISEKDRHKDEKSPVAESVDEEISPTCSVQSSDAFADISSAMTSEHLGLSLSSPTKVTVKYSDPNTATGLGEMHSNIITSTTRSELISVEPNLPEKITILSSGVSSSSEDTLRLESGKIHVITSNIQATPESLHAKLLTAVQVQPAGGLPLQSEANESASWTVEDSQGSKRTVIERHVVRETSSERSEGKETIVITKQITHRFDSSEPISGDTASSIQRLRDSVHSEKMKFFDGAKK